MENLRIMTSDAAGIAALDPMSRCEACTAISSVLRLRRKGTVCTDLYHTKQAPRFLRRRPR